MQANIRPLPGFTSAQIFLTSAPQTFLNAAALARTAWHGADNSLTCDLMQVLMRPSPGCTPAHWALMSAAHSFATVLCAIELVAESNTMAPTASTFFNIVSAPFSSLIDRPAIAWRPHGVSSKAGKGNIRGPFASA